MALALSALLGPGIRWGIMGPNLIIHLGSGGAGLVTFLKKQRESFDLRLSQMADWKEMPQSFVEMADQEIQDAISHRPAEIGNTYEALIQYRDSKLIELLKLHNKI